MSELSIHVVFRTLPPVVPIKVLDSCDESLLLIRIRWQTFQYWGIYQSANVR